MWLSCWAVLAFPYRPSATHWLDLDASKMSIFANMLLLLQLRAQAADVWQRVFVIWLSRWLLA